MLMKMSLMVDDKMMFLGPPLPRHCIPPHYYWAKYYEQHVGSQVVSWSVFVCNLNYIIYLGMGMNIMGIDRGISSGRSKRQENATCGCIDDGKIAR